MRDPAEDSRSFVPGGARLRAGLLLISIILVCLMGMSQEIVENEAKPSNPNAKYSFSITTEVSIKSTAPVISVSEWEARSSGQIRRVSAPEFKNDVFSMHVVDGKIWIQTSTIVKGKGILFDVFSAEGRYVDHFFLQPPSPARQGRQGNMMLTIVNGFAYFRERTDDELIIIKKCRIVGY